MRVSDDRYTRDRERFDLALRSISADRCDSRARLPTYASCMAASRQTPI